MLELLLKAQKEVRQQEPELTLINYQELVAIQVTWHRDSIFNFNVADIYNKVNGTDFKGADFGDMDGSEKNTLQDTCRTRGDFDLLRELLEIQKSKFILVNSYGLQNEIEDHLERHVKNQKA